MKLSFVTVAKSTAAIRFKAVRTFSEFLVEEFGILLPQEVTREVMIDYLNYLADCDYSPSTRHQRLSLLKGFLELCVMEGWANIPPYILTPQDYLKATKKIIKFIPKEKLEKFQNTKTINVSGNTVSFGDSEQNIDLQFFKKNVLAQALPNGYCARPASRSDCPHANACLTCEDFRTTKEFLSVHKEELVKTEEVIEKAKANSWERQIKINSKVANNLKKIIGSLEEDSE